MSGVPQIDFTPIIQLAILGMGAFAGILLMFLLTGISLLFPLPFTPLWGLAVPIIFAVIGSLALEFD